MAHTKRHPLNPLWWTLALAVTVIAIAVICSLIFAGTLRSTVPITVVSDRTGLVMEPGAKVKLRGVEVGRVTGVTGGSGQTSLKLALDPNQLRFIAANVDVTIKATTAFGAKYVDLSNPENPRPERLAANAVLRSGNVSTEVNTVFENVVDLLKQVDVYKINATLTALSEGLRGQGPRIAEATTDANQVLLAINPRMDTVAQDWRSLKGFSDSYGAAAPDIVAALDAASVTSRTVTDHAEDLDALLLSATGFANSAINLLSPSTQRNFIDGVNGLLPTTELLMKYNPEITCSLLGAKIYLDGAYKVFGGNGRTLVTDSAVLLGQDAYRFPDNLPVIGARGGPGGKPGCGGLPDVSKNLPVRSLVTNTGYGTGMDIRPNPGVGFPGIANFFPVTKANPEPPHITNIHGGPAPGPMPYPGGPPYGAQLYAPDGTPLYPGLPPAPPPGAPREPGVRPGEEPFVVPHPAGVQPRPFQLPPPPPDGYQPSP